MSKERASDSAEVASWEGMEWLVGWKKPNRELAERRLERRVSAGSEREISGGVATHYENESLKSPPKPVFTEVMYKHISLLGKELAALNVTNLHETQRSWKHHLLYQSQKRHFGEGGEKKDRKTGKKESTSKRVNNRS